MAEKNELEKAAPQMPAQVSGYNYGSGNIFQHVDTVNIYKSADGMQRIAPQTGFPVFNRMVLNSLSHERFCIFVMEDGNYASGNFSICVDNCLVYTKKNIREQYCCLDEEAMRDILNMPVILATKNQSQKESGQWQYFYLAKIDSITKQENMLRIEFRTDAVGYRQQLLNEHCKELGLVYAALGTELDEIHWAIKEGDLLGLLGGLGI